MANTTQKQSRLPRLEAAREERLRDILIDMAISQPSGKVFDQAEMELLYDDVRQLLGEIDHLRSAWQAVAAAKPLDRRAVGRVLEPWLAAGQRFVFANEVEEMIQAVGGSALDLDQFTTNPITSGTTDSNAGGVSP